MTLPEQLPTAKDLMTKAVVTVDRKTGILEAAECLLDNGVSNAPVVENDFTRQILLGFVSEKDLLQCYANGEFYERPDLTVTDVMRAHPVCVKPGADLFTLAAIFMQHGFRHLPVVESQILLGMASRRDVLRHIVLHSREWLAKDPRDRVAPDLRQIFAHRFMVD